LIELSENITNYIQRNFGDDYLNNFREHYLDDHNIYLRFPIDNSEQESLIQSLETYGIKLEKHPNVNIAYKVVEGSDKIGKTLEYTIGRYYIQSLSSMIPPLVLLPNENDVVLDMCAAPGSKSTQLSEMMNNSGTLYSNEPNAKRVKSLVYNLDRMTRVNMGVIQKYGEILSKKFDHFFDKVLVDAPCSGLGIVQKKGEISNWWNEKSVERISDTQLRLLISAIKTSKVGGEIIYSTCTLTVEENELILDKILKKYPVELADIELPIPSHPAITKVEGRDLNPQISKARRIIPWEVASEGFFVAKLIKVNNTDPVSKEERRNFRDIKIVPSSHRDIKDHLSYVNEYYGIPLNILQQYKYIIKSRDIGFVKAEWVFDDPNTFLRIGTRFGSLDKNGKCHLNSLAVQVFSNHITKNIVELDSLDQVKTYMTGGTIKSITNLLGSHVIKYAGSFLGTAVGSKDGLKSQYPRAMRTHEVLLPQQ
jgi:16S rRNA (cytosine1407-C5)-methyltransferase